MERRVGRFQILVGCFSVVGAIFTVVTAIIAIIALFYPRQLAVIVQDILPTATPIVITLPTQTPIPTTPTPRPTVISLPFQDNFDAGPRSEWEALLGEWGMVGGEYTLIDISERPAVGIAIVGDASWDNYAIECDLAGLYDRGGYTADVTMRGYGDEFMNQEEVRVPEYSRAAILIGMDDDGDAAGLIIGATLMEWGLLKEWNWTVISGTLIEGYGETGAHIRITVRGNSYEAWVNGKVVTSMSAPAVRKGGRVGIWLKASNKLPASDWRAVPKMDNFSVTPLE